MPPNHAVEIDAPEAARGSRRTSGALEVIRGFRLAARAWTIGAPLVACFIFALVRGRSLGWMLLAVAAISLVAAVVAAVHHAEVIALRVGEPFGTLVLALAVTIMEVSLIVSLMLSGSTATTALARDTVLATVMIVCNGVVGQIGRAHV